MRKLSAQLFHVLRAARSDVSRLKHPRKPYSTAQIVRTLRQAETERGCGLRTPQV